MKRYELWLQRSIEAGVKFENHRKIYDVFHHERFGRIEEARNAFLGLFIETMLRPGMFSRLVIACPSPKMRQLLIAEIHQVANSGQCSNFSADEMAEVVLWDREIKDLKQGKCFLFPKNVDKNNFPGVLAHIDARIPIDSGFVIGSVPTAVGNLGRSELGSLFKNELSNFLNQKDHRIMLAYGKPGVGKTFLAASVLTLENLEPFGLNAVVWTNAIDFSQRQFIKQLASHLSVTRLFSSSDFRQLCTNIEISYSNKRILVVVDDVSDGQVARTLQSLPKGLKFLCLGNSNFVNQHPHLFAPNPFHVPPLNNTEAKTLFREKFSEVNYHFYPSDENVQKIVNCSDHLPVWIPIVAWSLGQKARDIEHLPEPQNVLREMFNSSSINHGSRYFQIELESLDIQTLYVCYAICCFGEGAIVRLDQLAALLNLTLVQTHNICKDLSRRSFLRFRDTSQPTCNFNSLIFEGIINFASSTDTKMAPFLQHCRSKEQKLTQLRLQLAKLALQHPTNSQSFFGRLIGCGAIELLQHIASPLIASGENSVLFDLERLQDFDRTTAIERIIYSDLQVACEILESLIFWAPKSSRNQILDFVRKPIETLMKTIVPGRSLETSAIHLAADRNYHLLIDQMVMIDNSKIDIIDSELNTALLRATKKVNANVMVILVAAGANPNIGDANAHTPLMEAVDCTTENLVAILLQSPIIDINIRDFSGNTALTYAILFGAEKSALLLLEKGAHIDESTNTAELHCFSMAIAFNEMKIAEAIIARTGLPVGEFMPGKRTELQMRLMVMRHILKINWPLSAVDEDLYQAVINEDCSSVLTLLSLNLYGHALKQQIEACCLTAAMYNSTPKLLQTLISEMCVDNFNFSSGKGVTCLMNAVAYGKFEIVEFLLNLNCEINATDDQERTAMHLAAAEDESMTGVQLALHPNTDVMARDDNGSTPFHLAAHCNSASFIRSVLLLKSKLPPNICDAKDDFGRTPLMVAGQLGNEEAVRALFSVPGLQPDIKIVDKQGRDVFELVESDHPKMGDLIHQLINVKNGLKRKRRQISCPLA